MRTADLVVIGGGAGGLSAAQYGARANLKTVLLDASGVGGQCSLITELENYPGIPDAITGVDFTKRMQDQASAFGAVQEHRAVTEIRPSGSRFILETRGAESIEALAVVIATGAAHKTLGLPREDELTGRGVSYCASCDGPMFRGQTMVVVGGGDAACDEAMLLAQLSERVIVVHRGSQFRAQGALAARVLAHPHIDVRFNTTVQAISSAPNRFGLDAVSELKLRDAVTGSTYTQAAAALFVFIGSTPNTELVPFVERDESGYVRTDERMESSVPGIYAVGDARVSPFRQLVVAAADGAIAAHAASARIQTLRSEELVAD